MHDVFFKFNIEIIWYIIHSDIHCKTENTTGNLILKLENTMCS